MSCSEWMNGSYKIHNKTEYNKVIKSVCAGYNKEIEDINTAIKKYKSSTKCRKSVDWNKFKTCIPEEWYGHYNRRAVFDISNWDIQQLISDNWTNRSGIPKMKPTSLGLSGVHFNKTRQCIEIDVYENNHAVDTWLQTPGIDHLWKALDQVKWTQRGKNKDGGYCNYWNEYHNEHDNTSNTTRCLGRIGKEIREWENKRPSF